MNFQQLFDFLSELQQNNNKEWMDTHRKWYQEVRTSFIQWLDQLNEQLADIDAYYFDTPGKKGINRINNNLLFHPNKPVYKDHFGAGLDQRTKQGDFYIHIGINECLLAGGYWKPAPKTIKAIREAIDYNGEELLAILQKKSFKNTFEGLVTDTEKLKKAPKGYANDHPFIELLKYKTFAVAYPLTKETILSPNFDQKIIAVYQEMLPFRRYLNQAVTEIL